MKPNSLTKDSRSFAFVFTGGAVIGLVLSLLIFMPAQWFKSLIESKLEQRVLFYSLVGTIWEGSTRLSLSPGQGGRDLRTLGDQLTWRMNPNWDGLTIELMAHCCMLKPLVIKLVPKIEGASVVIDAHDSVWPSQLLTGLGAPWNTLNLSGNVKINSNNIHINLQKGVFHLDGQIQLTALNLGTRLTTINPLGSYQATISGGNIPQIKLNTLRGSLILDGQGQWIQGRLRFNGVAAASSDREKELSNLLNIIGRRSGLKSIISIG